jgi:hypothetical protein
MGALRAAHERGLRIPEDVSVAGFDDIAMSSYVNPPLTTVCVHAEKVGRTAMRLCLDRMRDRDRPTQSVCLPAELVLRGSTGPAPASTMTAWETVHSAPDKPVVSRISLKQERPEQQDVRRYSRGGDHKLISETDSSLHSS